MGSEKFIKQSRYDFRFLNLKYKIYLNVLKTKSFPIFDILFLTLLLYFYPFIQYFLFSIII